MYALDSDDNLDFTSFISQSLKGVFDAKFDAYKVQLSKLNDIAPKAISTHLEKTVSAFFGKLDEQLKQIEK